MGVMPLKRHDSFSPQSSFFPPPSPPSHLVKRGQQGTGPTASTFTFVVSNASDYDAKAKNPARRRIPGPVPTRKSSANSRDSRRMPSLAATHPAMYQAPVKACKADYMPCSLDEQQQQQHKSIIKKEKLRPVVVAVVKPEPHRSRVQSSRLSPPPWRTYVDPKRLTSDEPDFDDPKLRMLKMDVCSDEARVVSPVLMIGLPCGTLIEAANVYQTHPRDAPSS